MSDGLSVDVSAIIVSYNTRALLGQCLRSLLDQTRRLCVEVIVVDNGSSDGSVQAIEEEFPSVSVIANGRNMGYAWANNQAIRASTGRFVLLLNPDTIVLERAIELMVKFMDAHPDAGACGCRLVYEDGSYQRSSHPLPSLLSPLYEYTGLFDRVPGLARLLMPDWIDRPGETHDAGYCSGACLLVPRRAIQQVGLMDDRFFLYGEDVDWCKRMWQAGKKVVYLPDATVVHLEGRSSSWTGPRRRLGEVRGEVQFLKKWHSPLYVRAYQILSRFCSFLRYVRLRRRQLREPPNSALLGDYVSFYRSVMTGRISEAR